MTDATQRGDERGFHALSRDELNALAGEELPERAATSLVDANVAIPIDAAVAAHVLSDEAGGTGDVAETTPIEQSDQEVNMVETATPAAVPAPEPAQTGTAP